MALDLKVNNFKRLSHHVGHDIVCVMYGEDNNVAIECETCGEVLIDYDNPDICQYCGGDCPTGDDGCDEWKADGFNKED